MAAPEIVSERVALELHPIAVKQARGRVLLQAAVIALFFASGVATDFRPDLLWHTVMVAVVIVAAVYDLRWWLWLRRADPVEAFVRLQARTGHEGGALRSWLTALVSVAAFALWWLLGR